MRLGIALTLAKMAVIFFLISPAVADFLPIPKELEDLYHFQLEKNFYPDDAGFEADLQSLMAKIEQLESLRGRVTESADNLYRAYQLSSELVPLWGKLWVYAYLRYAINTNDMALLDRIQTTSGDLEGRIQFVRSEVQRMDEDTYRKFRQNKPQLKRFAFAIQQALRYQPHTLPLAQEEILSQMDPYLTPWAPELYQKCVDRTEFPDLVVTSGETLDVNMNYNLLINDTSRVIRQDAWQGYFHSMNEHRDLYALALVKSIQTRNKLAQLRGFSVYPQMEYFDQFLAADQVNSLYRQIADHAKLYKDFQLLRQKGIRAATGYDTVYTWDRSVVPRGFEKPRWDIRQASDLIIQALSTLGPEYHDELASLLDPHQGRLDLVAGENRVAGAFAYGYSGAPWQFYSFAYEGYFQNVSTLAHEAGHAVHYKTLTNEGVEPLYYDGPSYITETVAMVNELLLIDHLYRQTEDLEMKTYLLEEFLKKALHFVYLNFIAHLEATIYQKVASGELRTADHLDALTREMGSKYNIYYQIHPEYQGVWNVIHHYYTHPVYQINYVIAGALSLKIFQEIQSNPAFIERYLKLVQHGFDRPGPQMIEETMGLDMSDPGFLDACFRLIEDKMTQLQGLYQQAGIPTD
jgi:oligoendopeptidase F